MLWPRTRRSAGNTSRGCANVDAEHERREELRDDVPGRLGRLRSCSTDPCSATHSPQPVAPSPSTRTSMNVRSSMRPKLVSKKWTSGRRSEAELEAIDVHGDLLAGACPRAIDILAAALALPLPRDRRPDRRGQDRARRAARHAARRHGRPRGRRRTRSSPTSTPTGPARRSRRSSSTCSTATGSRPALRQADLFSQMTICDYLFDKDKIYAYLNLDDNELFIYQRLYDLLARDVPPPDLVVYLQAPTDVLLRARCASRARGPGASRARARRRLPAGAERGLPALLLPLHRHAAARRRDLAVRSRTRATRRSTIWSSRSAAWAAARGTTCRGQRAG